MTSRIAAAPDLTRSHSQVPHYVTAAAFLGCLALLLLALVDVRRGFLFAAADYTKIGAPSATLYLDGRHLPLLLLGALGAWLAYRRMARLEEDPTASRPSLRSLSRALAAGLGVLLLVDLFTYRSVPASRILASGQLGIGQAIPHFPGWLKPLSDGFNYMALVWHATTLGILIGGLFLTVGSAPLRRLLGGKGFASHLAGAALALPQPFCSCCAAPIGATLYRSGAALGPTLAFVVSAPMLNITTLVLAVALLPAEFALLRIAGGVVVAILVTRATVLIASRWVDEPRFPAARPGALVRLATGAMDAYNRLFHLEAFLSDTPADTPATLVRAWLGMSWHLARIAVPVLFLGSVLTAAVVMVVPAPSNDALGLLAAAALGTLLMIPTWTEIPVAAGLLQAGLTAPAAALLLTLPAVSVPCLVILAGAVSNLRVALLLGLSVFATGLLAGGLFLLL